MEGEAGQDPARHRTAGRTQGNARFFLKRFWKNDSLTILTFMVKNVSFILSRIITTEFMIELTNPINIRIVRPMPDPKEIFDLNLASRSR